MAGPSAIVTAAFAVVNVGCNHCPTCCSDEVNTALVIAPGQTQLAASWEVHGESGRTVLGSQAVLVSADGQVGTAIDLPRELALDGIAGTHSALWYGNPFGPSAGAHAVLDRGGGDAIPLSISEGAEMHAATFDGTSYRVAWIEAGRLHERAISEAGDLGAVVDLGPVTATADALEVSVRSDGAGALYVLVDSYPSASFVTVEDATGASHLLWTDPAAEHRPYAQLEWIADRLMLLYDDTHGALNIAVLDPETGLARPVPLPYASLRGVTDTRLYADGEPDIIELDTSFAIIAHHAPDGVIGTVGSDLVYFVAIPVDQDSREPGRLAVARELAGSANRPWQSDVVVDSSPVHPTNQDLCLSR